MRVKERIMIGNDFLKKAASYRVRMRVCSMRKYRDSTYPVCPRCQRTMPREYQKFCDRCGQALSWKDYR